MPNVLSVKPAPQYSSDGELPNIGDLSLGDQQEPSSSASASQQPGVVNLTPLPRELRAAQVASSSSAGQSSKAVNLIPISGAPASEALSSDDEELPDIGGRLVEFRRKKGIQG